MIDTKLLAAEPPGISPVLTQTTKAQDKGSLEACLLPRALCHVPQAVFVQLRLRKAVIVVLCA